MPGQDFGQQRPALHFVTGAKAITSGRIQGLPTRGVRASLLRISPSNSTDLAECDVPRYPRSALRARYHPGQCLRTRCPPP